MRDYYLRNKEKIIANVAQHAAENHEQIVAYQREYYLANAEKAKARASEWVNKNRNIRRAIVRKYDAANKAQKRHRKIIRLGREARAMPAWADIKAMNAFYAACPPGHHVDHIIPLVAMRGRQHIASGLHCEANLQYLPARENCRKGATMPEG